MYQILGIPSGTWNRNFSLSHLIKKKQHSHKIYSIDSSDCGNVIILIDRKYLIINVSLNIKIVRARVEKDLRGL